MDRKGISIRIEEQSVTEFEAFALRVAGHFVAAQVDLHQAPGFERQLRARGRVDSESGAAVLFEFGATPR